MIATSLSIFMLIVGTLSTIALFICAVESETRNQRLIFVLGMVITIAILSFGIGGLIYSVPN